MHDELTETDSSSENLTWNGECVFIANVYVLDGDFEILNYLFIIAYCREHCRGARG